MNMEKYLIISVLFLGGVLAVGCDDEKEVDYENHNISACGVDDPLRNIEWLKTYCENLKEAQGFSSVSIDLYKDKGIDEYIFFVRYSTEDRYAISTNLDCINCNGDAIFHFGWLEGKGDFLPMHPDSAPYDEFIKDKEYIAKLFHLGKQYK